MRPERDEGVRCGRRKFNERCGIQAVPTRLEARKAGDRAASEDRDGGKLQRRPFRCAPKVEANTAAAQGCHTSAPGTTQAHDDTTRPAQPLQIHHRHLFAHRHTPLLGHSAVERALFRAKQSTCGSRFLDGVRITSVGPRRVFSAAQGGHISPPVLASQRLSS